MIRSIRHWVFVGSAAVALVGAANGIDGLTSAVRAQADTAAEGASWVAEGIPSLPQGLVSGEWANQLYTLRWH